MCPPAVRLVVSEVPWSIQDREGCEVGIVWAPEGHQVVVDNPKLTPVLITDPDTIDALRREA